MLPPEELAARISSFLPRGVGSNTGSGRACRQFSRRGVESAHACKSGLDVTLQTTATAAGRAIGRRGMGVSTVGLLDRETVLGYVLMTPALLLLIVFIAYPFVLGVWYSMSDVKIVGLGDFIGLKNYGDLLQSPVFQQTVRNSFVYTGVATVFK